MNAWVILYVRSNTFFTRIYLSVNFFFLRGGSIKSSVNGVFENTRQIRHYRGYGYIVHSRDGTSCAIWAQRPVVNSGRALLSQMATLGRLCSADDCRVIKMFKKREINCAFLRFTTISFRCSNVNVRPFRRWTQKLKRDFCRDAIRREDLSSRAVK